MNKKILSLCITSLLFITSISFVNVSSKTIGTGVVTLDNPVVLDQYQNDTNGVPMVVGRHIDPTINKSYQMAQSFIPTKEVLTNIELYICKNFTTNHPFVVGIRDELSGINLAETAVSSNNINTINISNPTLNFSWVGFNFNDMFFDIGETYYIVCCTENATDNWYLWGHNNQSDSYLNGEAYVSEDDGNTWTNNSKSKPKPYPKTMYATLSDGNNQSDMCFKTYGVDATQLEIDFLTFNKGLNASFENKGDVNATGVHFEVTIQGGILNLINDSIGGLFVNPIVADGSYSVEMSIFGLGMVDITASAYAGNAKLETKTARGVVIGSYIFVIPF